MKKLINFKLASNIILTICTLALMMHICILFRVIPYHFVWGGRINSSTDLIIFESLSILVQLIFLSFVAIKAGYLFKGKATRLVNIGIWFMFILMILNTLGNLASMSSIETIVMTPLTLLLALLLYRVGIE